eukprot:scaffold11097_cov116-Isochrysis_galbana.AAC.1
MLGICFSPDAYSGLSSTSNSPAVHRPKRLLENNARRRGDDNKLRTSAFRFSRSAGEHEVSSKSISAITSSAERSARTGARHGSVADGSPRLK